MRHLRDRDRTLCGKPWAAWMTRDRLLCFSCRHSLILHATDRGGLPARFQSITRLR